MSPLLLVCYLTEHSAVKFVKKLFGEKDVEAVLQRLDRLTQDEARTAAAQILEVVHGLVQGMREVMDGKQNTPGLWSACCSIPFPLDGNASLGGVREALGTFFKDNRLVLSLTER